MSAILGQVAAAVGAIKMMSGLKSAWTRAHADGVRLWQVPSWLAYTGGRDPRKDMRCADCRKVCGDDVVTDSIIKLPLAKPKNVS